jgi:hypothetical protein
MCWRPLVTSRYKLLPATADYVEIARICRECIELLLEKTTYKEIVSAILNAPGVEQTIREASLKTFISRKGIKRVNTSNVTLEAIYNYFITEFYELDATVQAIIQSKWRTFNPISTTEEGEQQVLESGMQRTLSTLFCEWVGTHGKDISRLKEKIKGDYIMLRRSVKNDQDIIKSNISIGKDDSKDYIDITHSHTDRFGVSRLSEGFVVPIVRSIHCIMKVENGEDIEVISLRNPIQQRGRFRRLLGFCQSINVDRVILSAKVYLEPYGQSWSFVPPRFTVADVENRAILRELIGKRINLIGNSACPTIPDDEVEEDLRNWDTNTKVAEHRIRS